MDLNRLTQGEKIAAGAAIALFILMFLSWFGAPDVSSAEADVIESLGGDTSFSAWQSFDLIDIILFLTVLAATVGAVVKATGNAVNVPFNTITAGLGALSTLLVLYRVLDPVEGADRKFGLFLGLIAAAAVTYGAYLAMQEEGVTFQDAADSFSDRVGGDDNRAGGDDRPSDPPSAPPPPPPPPTAGP